MPGTRRMQPHPTAVQLPIYVPAFVLQDGVDYIVECISYGAPIALNHLNAMCTLITRYPERLPGIVPEPSVKDPQWATLIKATLQNAIGTGAKHWHITPLADEWTVLKPTNRHAATPAYLRELGITLSPS